MRRRNQNPEIFQARLMEYNLFSSPLYLRYLSPHLISALHEFAPPRNFNGGFQGGRAWSTTSPHRRSTSATSRPPWTLDPDPGP